MFEILAQNIIEVKIWINMNLPNQTHLIMIWKKKFDDNTEFAKEFTNPYDDFKKAINIDNYNIDDELLEGRKNKAKK